MLERYFLYSQRVQLSANEIRQDQHMQIRPNADFFMRALGWYTSSGAIAARMRRADSSWLTGNQFSHLTGLVNTGGAAGGFPLYTPIFPQVRYPASGLFKYDLQDLGGAGDQNVYPLLVGVERYPDGALPRPALPANYIELADPGIVVTQTISAVGQQVLSVPVRCKTGDCFAIRSFSWRFLESSSEPNTLAVVLNDEYGRAFSNSWVPMRLMFSGPTEAAVPFKATPFPQLVIPANGAFTIDFWNRADGAGPFTVELTFGGVRCVAVNS